MASHTAEVPGQLALFDAPTDRDEQRLRLERKLEPFRGPLVPLAWSMSAHPDQHLMGGDKPRRGDLLQHWRCPHCGALEQTLYHLDGTHGWDPLAGERPEHPWLSVDVCDWQWDRMGQSETRPVPRCAGVWAPIRGEWQRVWTEGDGFVPGYVEQYGGPLQLTGVVWAPVVVIGELGTPVVRYVRSEA